MMSENFKEMAIEYANKNQEQLFNYIRKESVSAQGRMITETAEFVKEVIEQHGGEAKILDDQGGHPIVYGYFAASESGNDKRTILFYNHYDVQPEDPIDEWETVPFEPTVKDGMIYGRGISDNKANFMARISAIEAMQNTDQGLPCNIKFFVEGEEEIGSPTINKYIEKYADLFQADACVWEAGGKDNDEHYVISGGVKGCAYFDFSVRSAKVDIHSSKAAVIDNAAWRMVQALATMRTQDNKIIVDDFYEPMIAPTDTEKQMVENTPFDIKAMRDQYDLTRPLITEDLDYSNQAAMMLYPTLTISGIQTGYTGEGTKTVLPSYAAAKVDVRIVPGYTPEKVYDILRNHLDNHGFDDVQIELITAVPAFRTNPDDPFVGLAIETARKIYGSDNPIFEINSAGSGPMAAFGEILDVPIVGAGSEWAESGAHGPNENIRITDYEQQIAYIMTLMKDFSEN